jgi:two-component system chemotaxis sensor kinase CheA
MRRLVKTSRMSQKKIQDISSFVYNHPEINEIANVDDLKTGLHDLGNQLVRIRDEATSLFDEVSLEVSQLDPIIDELQLRMKQIRMLPIGHLFETFPRLVRDVAVAQGKKVRLNIAGEETELDKKVLESIKPAFIHLLRNSVDHGIELPEDRIAAGKESEGTISLRAYHKGGNVVIELEDDGRGIDIDKIKETAISKGLVSISEISNLTREDIINFIFFPGFSTAPIITDISGRGVGLDVVKTDIENLKGNITIDSSPGKGTLFTLQLPLTVAIIQALLVRSSRNIFAIPLLSIEECIFIPIKQIASIENRRAIQIRNRTISVVRLSDLLNIPRESPEIPESPDKADHTFIVILNSMNKLLGIEVDEIIGEQEVFIKSLDENLGKLKNVSGATILGSGEVIIILDILDLFSSSKTTSFFSPARLPSAKTEKVIREKTKRILIVEDSLTTRELEKSILQTHGYSVDTSVDGMDALSKMQSQGYDLIISDVEMPKMDGFELCKIVKQNPDLKDIPFIIVTALEKKEDKRRGIEVGAQAYIVKSTFDQSSLIDTIKRLIG